METLTISITLASEVVEEIGRERLERIAANGAMAAISNAEVGE